MAYSELTNIQDLLPDVNLIQLTDDEDTGAINEDTIDEAIAQADAEIDLYCSPRYTVPFSPVPAVIKKFSVDIAIYNLYSRKVEEIPETRSDRYKNAIKQLEAIAAGTLLIEIEEEGAADSGIKASATKDDRIFTLTTMQNM